MKQLLLIWGILFLSISNILAQDQLRVVGEGKLASGELIDKNIRDANGRQAAAVKIKTDLTGLSIEANNGVIKMNTKQGEYDVFVSPDERVLTIRKSGYVALKVLLPEYGIRLKSGQMWTLTITGDKKLEQTSVNFIITPDDAQLTIDGKSYNPPYKGLLLSVGKHQVEVKKDGFATHQKEITVSVSNSLFEVELKPVELQVVTIKSMPMGATFYVDGIEKGQTDKQLFMYSGKYTVKWLLSGYVDAEQQIEVKEGAKNEFTINLDKNTGLLSWKTTPVNANVTINKEPQTGKTQTELAPGRYLVELSAEGFDPLSENIEIKRGERVQKNWTLNQQTGGLQFSVEPYNAKVTLKRNNQTVETWTGLKILKDVPVGTYQITAELNGYERKTQTLTIQKDKTQALELILEKAKAGAISTSGAGKTITNSIGMEFVLIPAGTFQMGSNESSGEKPVHSVTISQPFYMGKYEVTQKQWKAVMGNNPSNWKGDNLPVEQVSWNDVQEFIKKLNQKEGGNKYRLPTEAEWEYAARAGTTTKWSFGDDESQLSKYGNFADKNSTMSWADKTQNDGYENTSPVGTYKPNPFGLYDMHGNVWEWCQDWHDSSYYSYSPRTDPQGPNSGSDRVLRGGSWNFIAEDARSAIRGISNPDGRNSIIGFRLVRLQ
ncbi:PEGA domain-containing protein [bacterium]|nr:MAG: PEGA domain-containing protein [bacterium]